MEPQPPSPPYFQQQESMMSGPIPNNNPTVLSMMGPHLKPALEIDYRYIDNNIHETLARLK